MKKIFGFTIVAMLVLVVEVSAQVKIGIGPRVGINFATLSSDAGVAQFGAVSTYSGRTGMLFGALVDVSFGPMFGVFIEPSYVMKGGTMTAANFFGAGTGQTKALSYIAFPIGFKVRWLKGQFIPYSFLGPDIGFNVSATLKSDAAQGFGGQNQDQDLGPTTSGFDFGMFFGSGFEYRMSPTIGILLDFRYVLGFTNVLSNQQNQLIPTATVPSEKNRGFQIITGALFYL